MCKPGITGKFYCSGALGGRCNCCNGYCGPTDGCNCLACMREDIRSRRLPPGFLVNKEGRTCGVGRETGRLYCAAKHTRRRVASPEVAYCRPEPYGQCTACEVLERQLRDVGGRYGALVSEWGAEGIQLSRPGEHAGVSPGELPPGGPPRPGPAQIARDRARAEAVYSTAILARGPNRPPYAILGDVVQSVTGDENSEGTELEWD